MFHNGPYLCGFTDSFRMGQILRYTELPKPEDDLDRFMVTTFVDAVRQALKDGGYASKDKEVESGGTFLVGVHGRLFQIESDYQVGESAHGFDAVGCGFELALGALSATSSRMDPRRRILIALKAAERFSAAVQGPFVIKETA